MPLVITKPFRGFRIRFKKNVRYGTFFSVDDQGNRGNAFNTFSFKQIIRVEVLFRSKCPDRFQLEDGWNMKVYKSGNRFRRKSVSEFIALSH